MMSRHNEDKWRGLVFNIQRFSLHDGPGIRTTIFLKGCNLSCKWCSNPEGIASNVDIFIYDEKCIRCGSCREVCRMDAIISLQGTARIDPSKCTKCMRCVEICPTCSLESVGSFFTADDLVNIVEKDYLFYRNSQGGVTLSGGDPLYQWQFSLRILKACQERGIHTALDTSGFSPWEAMSEVLNYVDLVLFDIKHLDPSAHLKATGVSNRLIIDNFLATARKVDTWLRFPIIPGFNDSIQHVRQLAELAAKAGVKKVSLLPFHEWGRSKYNRLGRKYILKIDRLGAEKLIRINTVFQEYDLFTEHYQ